MVFPDFSPAESRVGSLASDLLSHPLSVKMGCLSASGLLELEMFHVSVLGLPNWIKSFLRMEIESYSLCNFI